MIQTTTIDTAQKALIAGHLNNWVSTQAAGSQNKASKMLKGVSVAYISKMIRGIEDEGLWVEISDKAWINAAKQVTPQAGWVIVKDLECTQDVLSFLEDSRLYHLTFGLVGGAGWSKTQSIKIHCAEHENSFWVDCRPYHTPKSFINSILGQMGITVKSRSIAGLMERLIEELRKREHPVITLNEADKLKDSVLEYFISFYNDLEGEVGLNVIGSSFLETRITRGAERGKRGFQEFKSRIGGRCIQTKQPTPEDQARICMANGVTDQMTINEIINKSDSDLRRVKRLVFAEKRKMNAL